MNPSKTTDIPALRISTVDHQRLRLLVETALGSQPRDRESLLALQHELGRANVMEPAAIPPDVVVMGSHVEIEDLESGEIDKYTLVYPDRADPERQLLSVLAPIGTAILGFTQGDTFAWKTPGGTRRLKIRSVEAPPNA